MRVASVVMFGARFDDAIAGRSFVLADPVDKLIAWSLEEVVPTFERAQAASANGNWVAGYVAYEAASAFDEALVTLPSSGRPIVWFGVFEQREWVDSEPTARDDNAYSVSGWTPSITRKDYAESFNKIKSHIRDGDSYQVNLTFPLTAAFSGDASAFYRSLIDAQNPAYASHLSMGDTHIVSASPERFFAISDGRIVTSPMKGTARRGRWMEEDQAARIGLAVSEKDKAENLMIVDLVRNDLGRIAEFGTVHVDDLYTVEEFKTVWQMTSTISAALASDVTLVDVFRALFPCGSVTGAPKTSSMTLISQVEESARGVYCGAVGFIPPGDGINGASFNVAIRTAVIDTAEGIATYGVGGGVTWYSDVEAEYDETVTKALVLARRSEPIGLIETLRWEPVGPEPWVLLDDHLDRLIASARYFSIDLDVGDVVAALNSEVESRSGPQKVRVVVGGDGVETSVESLVGRFSMGPSPESGEVVLAIDPTPVDPTDPAMFHKTTNRQPYTMRAERHKDADDVVLVNDVGLVTETTVANIAIRTGDVWITPPREDGLLAGVLRNHLVTSGVIKERSITVDELLAADAVAVLNSVRGWRRAVVARR